MMRGLEKLSKEELQVLHDVVLFKHYDEIDKAEQSKCDMFKKEHHDFAKALFSWSLEIGYWLNFRTHEHDNEGEPLIEWAKRKAAELEAEEAKRKANA